MKFLEGMFVTIGSMFIIMLAQLNLILMMLATSIPTGTILWVIYPYLVKSLFPLFIENGALSYNISWFSCVGLIWIISILFSRPQTATIIKNSSPQQHQPNNE